MNYQWHYDRLIETRKLLNRNKKDGNYYENHHIIMKSMGGTNDPENLVLLTAREHFIAHWLLWRIHRNKQTAFAFFAMCCWENGRRYVNISSRTYEESRYIVSSYMINNTNGKGSRTDKQKANMRESAKNRIYSEEGKIKLLEAFKNRKRRVSIFKGTETIKIFKHELDKFLDDGWKRGKYKEYVIPKTGKIVSTETREKMGAWQRGRKLSEETRKRLSISHSKNK